MEFRFLYAVFVVVLLAGCGSDGVSSSMGEDVVRKYGFETQGSPVITSTSLPADFTEQSWRQKSEACRDAGYDLTRHAGQNVSLIRYSVKEKYWYRAFIPVSTPSGNEGTQEVAGDLPLDLWVMVREQETVCGYLTVSDPDMEYLELLSIGLIPSPFMAVNDEHIR